MNSTQILQYDPLVSDSACHTRAAYLIYLSRKSRAGNLSKEELGYLEACNILTKTQFRKYDAFGIIVDERTDTNKIPSEYGLASASNTKKNTFLAQKKSEVAKTTLDFLQENCKELTLYAEFDALRYQIPTMKHYTPVVPLYVSAKMMLHYSAKQAIPIMVNLKRLTMVDEQFFLDGAASIVHRFDSEKGKFIQEEVKDDQEAIAIDMVSCYVKNTEKEVNGFLTTSTFQAFMQEFGKEDLAMLILLCAAGHPPYPASAEPTKSTKPSSATEEKSADKQTIAPADTESNSPAKFQFDLNRCTENEIKQLSALARHYGFFREGAQYAKIDNKNKKLTRTNTCLPFYVDHVYASTLKSCQEKTALLLAQRDNLKAAREETYDPPKLGSK